MIDVLVKMKSQHRRPSPRSTVVRAAPAR
jgi:hypothetical protein